MQQVRLYLHGVWSRYKERRIDLVTATVNTNAAIRCFKDLEEELTNRYPLFSKSSLHRFDVLANVFHSSEKTVQHNITEILEDKDFLIFSETATILANCAEHYQNNTRLGKAQSNRPRR